MASSPAAWPLLTRVLGEVRLPDDLVRWGLDEWGCRRVVGLRELRVAALLFANSQEVDTPSASPDWKGFVEARFDEEAACVHVIRDGGLPDMVIKRTRASSSLLDLALRFGHAELARCLQARGLQQRALRPEDLQRLPVGSLAKLPFEVPMMVDGDEEVQGEIWIGEWQWEEERGDLHRECWCRPRNGDWQQMRLFRGDRALHPWQQQPDDSSAADAQGHWASDWKAPTPWVRALVDAPATRAVLALAAEGLLPDLEEGAKLRLLDAALLLGEPEAAAALAGSCSPRRPLRIWDCSSVRPRRHPPDLAPEYAEAHLRAGLRDVRRLGLDSAVDAAGLAVEAGAPGLARAVAELLPEGMQEMMLICHRITERGALGNAILQEVALAALEVLGPLARGCSVLVFARCGATQQHCDLRVPLLFLPVLLGDKPAATRLARAGFTLQAEASSGGSSISRDLVEHLRDQALELGYFREDGGEVRFSLKPVASRLEVAERTLRLLFKAAASHPLCAVAATGRRGLLGRAGLLEHVAGFAAVWTDGEAVLRQELAAMIGRDPLRGLSLRSRQRGAPAPVTAATAQASPAAPPGHPSSEQVAQQAAGGHAAECFADSTTGPGQKPPVETRRARPLQQVASPSTGPAGEAAGTEGHTTEKEKEAEDKQLNQVLQQSELEALQQDVQRALLLSKEQTFITESYMVLRLTKHTPQVIELLRTAEELLPCRERVLEAGCELQPEWAGGALLFVPTTRELYQSELALELKGHNVLLLKSDVGRLKAALRRMPCRRQPQVQRDHRADWCEGVAEGPTRDEASDGEGGPHAGGPAHEEGVEQPSVGAGAAGSADEVVLVVSETHAACLTTMTDQEDLLRSFGIEVQATFLGKPANHFELSEASAVAHSAPAELGRSDDEVPRQVRASGTGLHARNPRSWRSPTPALD